MFQIPQQSSESRGKTRTSRNETRILLHEINIKCEKITEACMANAINHFFINIREYIDTVNYNEGFVTNSKILSASNFIMLALVFSREIYKIVASIKNDVAAGEDDIKIVPLKHVSALISPVFSDITYQFLTIGRFPNKLIIPRVIPADKGDDRDDSRNYRPSSVRYRHSLIYLKRISIKG